jgi:anti-anti-sigma factor
MPARVEVIPTDEPRGLRVIGEVDISNVAVLSEAIDRQLALEGDLTLDLSEVTFMDSAGIQTLFRAARSLERRGTLVLVSPQPRLISVFRYVLLDSRANVEIRER